MAWSPISTELEAEFSEVAGQAGCELYHIGLKGGVLQIVLDHPQGVTHSHCETVSKQVSAILDVEDFAKSRYTLEVTSPGLDRQLYRARDYRRFQGHKVRITFFEGPTRKQSTVVGELLRFEDAEGGVATLVQQSSGAEQRIPLADIKIAKLLIEF